jgi:PadR family transcriptional regulator PadR
MLSETEIAVVAALIQQPLYGTQLIDRVAEISNNRVRLTVGGVYTTLNRMQKKGLISGYWGDDSEIRGGARRRYYKVTGVGQRAFQETRAMILSARWRPASA